MQSISGQFNLSEKKWDDSVELWGKAPYSITLSQKGLEGTDLQTTASVSVDLSKGGITGVDLKVNAARIVGLSDADFLELAQSAKKNCLLSKALATVNITLTVNYGILEPQA